MPCFWHCEEFFSEAPACTHEWQYNPIIFALRRLPHEFEYALTVFCVDAKLNFDDNALFRQKEVFAMRDTVCAYALRARVRHIRPFISQDCASN